MKKRNRIWGPFSISSEAGVCESYIWSYEQVLHMVDEKEKLLLDIQTRKLKYFGHLIRANGKQRELLEGHIEGKRGRGRKKRDWVKDIELCTQDNYVNCVKKANDRTL